MQHTTNLNLNKPELTDAPPDITVLNENWDTLDTEIKALQENKADKELTNVTNSDFWAKSQSAGVAMEVVEVNTNYTLALTNAGDLIKCTNTNAIVITIPTNSVPFPVGTVIEILRYGAGYVAIKAANGVTLGSGDSTTPLDLTMVSSYESKDVVIPTQFKSAILKKIGNNEWILTGDVYRIKSLLATFTSSGSWPVPAGIVNVDAFVVGGGGGTSKGSKGAGGGAGGGYCKLYRDIPVSFGENIDIVVGAGGTKSGVGGDGGSSRFKDLLYSADGGKPGGAGGTGNDNYSGMYGGAGGSGGGGGGGSEGGPQYIQGGNGGSNGSSGENGTKTATSSVAGAGGAGGGTIEYTPRNPYNDTLYGGGGGGEKDGVGGAGGGGNFNSNGTPNTGGGAGATRQYDDRSGGSGIVLIYG